MNNPLAVISGRSQLLAMTLPSGSKESQAARTISEQAHRLSDLISSLRMFADPPRATLAPTDVSALLQEVVRSVRIDFTDMPPGCEIYLQMKNQIPLVNMDAAQISLAISELMFNAIQAVPRHLVQLTATVTPDHELMVQVSDDGVGMDAHTLAHALDPFFSAKPAGRRAGMGLTRAKLLVEAHQGRIELRSTHTRGSVATLFIPIR
jgi:signal transduction histidine kinase